MEIQKYIYIFLRKAGMTIEGACAVLGNLQGESAFIPTNVEDKSGISDSLYTQKVDNGSYSAYSFAHDAYGYGLAQWTYYTRKQNMYKQAKAGGYSIGDYKFQTSFLVDEMKKSFPSIWKLCCESHDLYNCTWVLLDKWENPEEKTNNQRVRYQYAQHWYSEFKDLDVGGEEIEVTPPQEKKVESWPPRTIDKKCSSWPEYFLMAWALVCHGYLKVMSQSSVPETFKALGDFQRAKGLDPDEVCGPKTWLSLFSF